MRHIDLNSDLGEGFGDWKMGMDEEVMTMVTSVNIAAGWHAGDPLLMAETVKTAGSKGLGIGVHPGFPDLLGFGRRNIQITPREAEAYVLYQAGALEAFVRAEGLKLQHLKPHGALYNMASVDRGLAEAIASAVSKLSPELILLGLSGSEMEGAARRLGVPFASEAFADRSYQSSGKLVPRSQAGAVISDEEAAIEQVIRMIKLGTVISHDGLEVPLKADSICVHGDNPHAVAFIKRIRERLRGEGIGLEAFGTTRSARKDGSL